MIMLENAKVIRGFVDEYYKPSAHSTSPHFHINFSNLCVGKKSWVSNFDNYT